MTTLNEQLKLINKELGEGTINELSKFGDIKIERVSSGSFAIDGVMGGGLPRGRLVEIYGEPSSGKTILSLFMIAEIQRTGGKAAFIDCENSFSIDFARNIGVDTDKLIFSQEVCAEDVLNTVQKLIETNELSIIVIDSVAAMLPRKEIDGEIGDVQVALMARIMSQALRKITSSSSKSKTSIVFINQIRQKIGIYYGNPNVTPGGKALKFYSSIRLEVRKGKNIENENKEISGNVVKIIASKNKTAAPFKEAEFEIYYDRGIDGVLDSLDEAIKREIIKKEGNTYSFNGEKLAVGRNGVREYLNINQVILREIVSELKGENKESNDKKKFSTEETPQAEVAGEKKT